MRHAATRLTVVGLMAVITMGLAAQEQAPLLPPLLLEDEGKWLMLKAEPRSPDECAYRFHLATENFVPAARGRVERGNDQKIALFAYNLDYDDGLRAGLRSADGAVRNANLSVLAHAPGSGVEASKLLVQLETADLPEGSYHLDFAVGEGQERKRASVPLKITPMVIAPESEGVDDGIASPGDAEAQSEPEGEN